MQLEEACVLPTPFTCLARANTELYSTPLKTHSVNVFPVDLIESAETYLTEHLKCFSKAPRLLLFASFLHFIINLNHFYTYSHPTGTL